MKPLVLLGCDHGGLELKEYLKGVLDKQGYNVRDLGTHSPAPVDYPDIAFLVATGVRDARRAGQEAFGVMIDGVGVASSMVCNRVEGIRSAPCWNEFTARSAREHNNAQVITLGGRLLGTLLAQSLVETFLTTPYGGGRHQPRVDKIHLLAGEPAPRD
ncbi:MAG: RpiB/LacA/LacB family sugar-phosphate isomerase [bacterium]